jgi:hypothetical protein
MPLAMGIFRFIDGGKGLHPKPFLAINYKTVGQNFRKFESNADA